jgi:hypothetical protein
VSAPAATKSPGARVRLDLRSGGWVLVLAGVLCIAVLVQWVARLAQRVPVIGDGQTVASYGFDLTTCLVPRADLVAAGFPKDGVPAMVEPNVFSRSQMEDFNQELRRSHRGKFLVGSDRVAGVSLGGQARAYPLSILSWHEVVNDTLAGRPIAVTYNPLCDSAAVFDRHVAGAVKQFGVSGLLYDSNLLMYDRQSTAAQESLWSQLQFRAVAGPAAVAAQELDVLPVAVLSWTQWQSEHADTTVLAPDVARMELYGHSYAPYFGSDKLKFPVSPLPPGDTPLKTPLIAVRVAGRWHALPVAEIAARAGTPGSWTDTFDGAQVTFRGQDEPKSAWLAEDADGQTPVVYAFWFAWYALQEDASPHPPPTPPY